MKKIIVALLFCCITFTAKANQPNNLSTQLKQIGETTQNLRDELEIKTIRFQRSGKGAAELRQLTAKMDSVKEKNQRFIAKILDDKGWPTGLNEEEHQVIYMVIEQAKKDFSEKYLTLVKEQAEKGTLTKGDYATLFDKIQMLSRQRQTYGTQTIVRADRTHYIWPISSPDSVDIKRQAVGLAPMDEFMLLLEQSVDTKVIWDKLLNPEDMPALLRNPL